MFNVELYEQMSGPQEDSGVKVHTRNAHQSTLKILLFIVS